MKKIDEKRQRFKEKLGVSFTYFLFLRNNVLRIFLPNKQTKHIDLFKQK